MRSLDLDKVGQSDPKSLQDDEAAVIEFGRQMELMAAKVAPIVGATAKAFNSSATQELFINFGRVSESIGAAIREHADKINSALKMLEAVVKIDWEEINKRHAEALIYAAENGWFIHGDMGLSEIAQIREIQKNGDANELNMFFSARLARDKESIRAKLVQDYPDRAVILNEAFDLHDEGRYYASIPLMITMAEGIGFERTNTSAFNVKGTAPDIARHFKHSSGTFGPFAEPLKIKHPMSKSLKGSLSRHTVLHGRDLDYGTELYSFQAMSFLAFIGWLLEHDERMANADH